MKNKKIRNTVITVFVILWTLLFHYESIRHFYLQPYFEKKLPQTKFLFPPAGWIMFYKVHERFGFTEVLGLTKEGQTTAIDPHHILATRTIGFDNIHRGILGNLTYSNMQGPTCKFLNRKFPYFDDFLVTAVYYPSPVTEPQKRGRSIYYQCNDLKIFVDKK